MTTIKQMRIRSPKNTNKKGYTQRVGKSLAELLKENTEIEMVAVGQEAVNTMMKALSYTQLFLAEEKHNCYADSFQMRKIKTDNPKFKSHISNALVVRVRIC